MSGKQDHNFSVGTIPQTWLEAAGEAPQGQSGPRPRSPLKLLPSGQSADLSTGFLAGLAMSIVFGYSWYQLATTAAITSPWLAIGLGALVAAAVRLGAGSPDPQARGILSVLLYLATWAVVMVAISRFLFAGLYDSPPTMADYEREILQSRLADPTAIVALIGGAATSIAVGYGIRPRR